MLGLIAGSLAFGGGMSAIPLVYASVVENSGWVTDQQFINALALANLIPTPLVMFVVPIGFIGAKFPGAILMALGMFLPAFSFIFFGYNLFEKMVNSRFVSPFLDALGAAVIGLVFTTGVKFTKTVVVTPVTAIVLFFSFTALRTYQWPYTAAVSVAVAAIASQVK